MRTGTALFLTLVAFSVCVLPLQSNTVLRTAEVASTLPSDMPVVFVDPLNVTADVGEEFTISVRVFNLSANFYPTEEAWEEGEPLPPLELVYWRYNLSLGYLYGLDLRLSWDPTILDYVSHTVMVPVDDHPGGILNGPEIVMVEDNVNAAAGNYSLTVSSQAPAEAFNAPDTNATVFNMTFTVRKAGKCDITLTNVDLAVDLVGLGFPFAVPQEIPHWTMNGTFRTPSNLLTRIESVGAGALVAGSLYDPAIHGENVSVRVSMKNDNDTVTDTFNLFLYEETTLLRQWIDESLSPDTTKTFNHTITGFDRGIHTITAEATILHGGEANADQMSTNVTVIDTPALHISGPSSAVAEQTVNFNASESVHDDPTGYFETYTWTLWITGETAPRATKTGELVYFELPPETHIIRNWTVMLVVKDNYGITARPLTGSFPTPTSPLLRPATEPYRASVPLEIEPLAISILAPENTTYQTNDMSLVFTVSGAHVWMGYSLDGQANTTIAENTTLPTLADGWHNVAVFANDTYGNTGMGIVYFTVDTATPNITNVVQAPLVDILPDTVVTVNATVTDATSGVKQVQLNCTFTNGTGTWYTAFSLTLLAGDIWTATIPPNPYGTNVTYLIIAEDNAGNTVTTEQTYGYKYEYQVVPEFSLPTVLLALTVATLLIAIIYKKEKASS